MLHSELVDKGERWLRANHFHVTLNDGFRPTTLNGEQPDVIGWRGGGLSVVIECKTSRSDFLSDRRKPFRQAPSAGMGDWRFFLTTPGLVDPDDLPEGWGLLYATPKTIRRIHGVPSATEWWKSAPFRANKTVENAYLVSALNRLAIKGRLPEVYDSPWRKGATP